MNRISKQNLVLPINLHDARITCLKVKDATSELIDGLISFEFDDGYYKVEENNIQQTGKSSVILSGIDFDYSHVYYYKENMRQEITFQQLAEDIQKNTLEVIDETYGYNLSKYACTMSIENDCYEVEVVIYHFNDTIYEWTY